MTSLVALSEMQVICSDKTRDVLAVDGADLSIERGEVVGLIGESGSGKTTLVRSLIGLLNVSCRIESGTVTFDGRRMLDNDTNHLRSVRGSKIGVVFQNPTSSLDPLQKIGTQIAEVIRVHSPFDRRQINDVGDQLLKQLGFDDPERVKGSYPHQLSGGMCQRAAIALALAPQPDLIIADECTSALDVTTQAEVVSLLRDIAAQRDLTLLFVTHDILLATELCTRLVVMYGGQIVEDGPIDTVLSAPRHPYTKALLDAVPLWQPRAQLNGIPGVPPAIQPGFVGCRFASRCTLATDECRASDVPWHAVSPRHGHRCLYPLGSP